MSCTHRRDFLKHSLLALSCVPIAATAAAAADKPTVYVCPPCGCPMDGREFDKPGVCPACGMPLVDKSTLQESERADVARPRVGILVFEGVQVIDFAAPYEVFGEANYDVFTIGPSSEALTTNMLLSVTPRYTLASAPPLDVLVVPGGTIHRALNDSALRDWIRARAAQTPHTLSVCNGAFLLAHAGLLEGLTVTTYHGAIDDLRRHGKFIVVTDQRFVDNGRIITSAGLSSGLDGALHVVSALSGRAAAQLVALNMEYDWKEDGSYVRAALADYRFLHPIFGRRMRLDLGAGYEETLENTAGTRTAWQASWQVRTARTPRELLEVITARIESRSGLTARTDAGKSRSSWTFNDETGHSWSGKLTTTSTADKGALRAELELSRAT